MASEIKVDTISEKTSANGITIDGVNIKDSALATAGSVPLSTIDIDGGTDIGAAVVDADLFIVDDGAGGTNRKVTASRIKTYAGASGDITTIDSILNTDVKIGEDDQTKIDFETANEIHFYADNAEQVYVADGIFGPQTDADVDLGASGVEWKDAYFDGTVTADAGLFDTLGIGTAKDLGAGLHIRTADSGGSAHANADELVIEGSGNSGLTIASGNSNNGSIFFSDDGDNNIGYIEYKHGTNAMTFGTNAANAINIDSTGAVTKPLQPSCLVGHNGTGLGNSTGDGTWKTLDFNTEIYDTNGDHSAGVFTAPVAGRYLSTITCSAQGVTSSENFMRLYCVASNRSDNNWSFHCDDMLWSSGGTAGIAINAVQIMDMDASDTLYWKVNFANGSKVVDIEDTILMSVECLG